MSNTPRLTVETTAEFKKKVEEMAFNRGFLNYKSYIIAVLNNDMDRLVNPALGKRLLK